MPEKPQNISYSLVERYYTAEKLTLIAGLLLIFLQAFGLDTPVMLPLLNVRLRDPSKLPLAITVILLLSVAFTWIEWKQSSDAARRTTLSQIRLAIVLTIALIAVWMSLPALTKGTTFASVSRLWYLGYVGMGLAIGMVVSCLVFATLMIRSIEEAVQVGLPRVPVATRSQFLVFGPILLGLLGVYFLANQYAPPGLMLVAPSLTTLPILYSLA